LLTKEINMKPTTDSRELGRNRLLRDVSERDAYTVMEVAGLLGLSRGGTYALIRAGTIPARRTGRRWIVPKRRFHDWLDD
jgi:excisionase family DNA binding protein